MTSVTDEEVRFFLLMRNSAPKAVRNLLTLLLPNLQQAITNSGTVLCDLRKKRIINQAQWNKLYPPSGPPSPEDFDISLMICLLRNITTLKIPERIDTSPGGDIERIRNYRNRHAHLEDSTIEPSEFRTMSSDLIEAIVRLLGEDKRAECEQFLTVTIKQSETEFFPKRAFWEHKLQRFHVPEIAKNALEKIKNHQVVVLTGGSGCGKSCLAFHICFELEKSEKYKIAAIDDPRMVNETHPKQIFVFDDVLGKFTLNQYILNLWYNEEMTLKKLLKSNPDIKILLTCRSNINIMGLLPFIKLDLLPIELKLSLEDKTKIGEQYLPEDFVHTLVGSEDVMKYDFFPLICSLSYECEKNKNLFHNPYDIISEEIENMKSTESVSFMALAIFVIFNGNVAVDIFNISNDENDHILNDVFNETEFEGKPSKAALKLACKTLPTYIKESGNTFKIVNDKMFDMLSKCLGKYFIQNILTNGSSTFIKERILFKTLGVEQQASVLLEEKYEELYFDRMVRNIETLDSIQIQYSEFREKFINYLKSKNLPKEFFPNRYKDKMTLLYVSAALGYSDICQFLIGINQHLVNIEDVNKETPLHAACKKGHSDVAELLIQNNVEVECVMTGAIKPLHLACWLSHTNIVKVLLTKTDDVNFCTEYGNSPLHIACGKGNLVIVNILIENRASVNQVCASKSTPLHNACIYENTSVVKVLMEQQANVNARADDQNTPLHLTSLTGNTDIALLLINQGANVNHTNSIGETPLYCSCKYGHLAIVKLLLKFSADVNKRDANGLTPLIVASKKGFSDIVEYLLKYRACVNSCDEKGETSLHKACYRGSKKIVSLLCQNGINVNILNKGRITALSVASLLGNVPIVTFLITHGANISGSSDMLPPLIAACSNGQTEVANVLCEHGADMEQTNCKGFTAIHSACMNGHKTAVEFLLEKGCPINCVSIDGITPLHVACYFGNKELVHFLLQNNACINQTGKSGRNSLMCACDQNKIEIVDLLLQNGVNVNQRIESDGSTALSISCRKGFKEITELLLDKGADVNIRYSVISNPLYTAYINGHNEIVNLLSQKTSMPYWNVWVHLSILRVASWLLNFYRDLV